jgi:putative oxidoreductase
MDQQLLDDAGKLVLRLTLGGLMLFHGVAKLGDGASLNWIGGQLSEAGLPEFIAYGVYIGEIVAPFMLVAGLYCRVGGVLVVVNMLFAVLLAHWAELFTLNEHGGYALELHAFYTLCAVTLALTGSGRFALRPD